MSDYIVIKSWLLYCNLCQTHRDKVTLEVDEFDGSLSYAHLCLWDGWLVLRQA